MRLCYALAFLLSAALVILAITFVPSCLGPLVEIAPTWKIRSWREQQDSLRKVAKDSARILRKKNNGKPVEEWCEEDQRSWRTILPLLDAEDIDP